MDTVELYSIAGASNKLNPYFEGVFPADMLPVPSTFPSCYIANTEDSTSNGQHWIAFNYPDQITVEYFDSYGLTPFIFPRYFNFIKHKLVNIKNITFNEQSVQAKDSSTCGLHCLFFLIKRYCNQPFTYIMDLEYSKNKCLNDCMVLNYFMKRQEFINVKDQVPDNLVKQNCVCKSKFVY